MVVDKSEPYFQNLYCEGYNFKRRKCVECSTTFWSYSDTLTCGTMDCNKKWPIWTLKAEPKFRSFKQFLSSFTNFFKSEQILDVSKKQILRRAKTVVRHSTTNMNHLCAGISAFESLLSDVQDNQRLEYFCKDLFISNQYCYRFYDRANISTNRHNTGFFMGSLHCFESLKNQFQPDWKVIFINVVLKS